MIKKILFLGPPGVGKGTIAQIAAKKKKWAHISTGDIFRAEVKNKTKIGLEIESIMNKGDYVSDEITNKLVEKTLKNDKIKKSGFILDGYPRTLKQAKFLESISINFDIVVLFQAPEELIIKRLLKRGRKDDLPEIISKRFKIYELKTKNLINFYKLKKILVKVNCENNIEQNYKNFLIGIGDD